jgi:hypothetical protein
MADDLILENASVLDLEIPGSVGTFSVGPTDAGESSIPVRYIQTHMRFTLDSSHQQRLFENLLPVREIFDNKNLGFDEIMQRDIDDSRVSTSLIPYLLSVGKGEAVKFFPPIVTVVVPVGPEKQLLARYPELHESAQPEGKYVKRLYRSGPPGDEAFEFELIEINGRLREFDNARLRVNTMKCKLVIVDGQHRAMALLALYRNLKGWPDKTGAFRDYYRRWSDIPKDNLKDITLPIVVCTFPTLAAEQPAASTVIRACRAVFLALNKHAKPVSTARNILLDDFDIIAHFERSVLETIKQIDGSTAQYPLRLWNFELDADENRIAVSATIAVSGVMHLFSMLERVLLSPDAPTGIYYAARKYGNVKYIRDTCLRRLNGVNLLGDEVANSTTRYAFTPDARELLVGSFQSRYGKYIVEGFQTFWPFQAVADAAIKLEAEVRLKHHDLQNHANLFQGQGILRVFTSYIDLLAAELDEKYPHKQYPPELRELLEQFEGTRHRLRGFQDQFSRMRAVQLLAAISESKVVEPIVKAVHELYRTMFTTSAFQTALFITFFSAIEALNAEQRVNGDPADDALFTEYIASLNAYFKPQSEQDAKRLLSVFSGKVTGSFGSANMKVTESAYTLRRIVVPGELKPDEWPKFRYILLEMWNTTNPKLQALIDQNVKQSRSEVLRSFNEREVKDYCEKHGIDASQIPEKKLKGIYALSVKYYIDALSELVGPVLDEERKRLEDALSKQPDVAPEEVLATEDLTTNPA